MKKCISTKLFPGALASAMERSVINQVTLSKASGIAVSRINNYLQGKYRTVKPAHVEALIQHATSDPAVQSELVKMYVLDLLSSFAKSLIVINPATPGTIDSEDWYLQKNRLPLSFRREFEELYKLCCEQPLVVEVLRGFIDLALKAMPRK